MNRTVINRKARKEIADQCRELNLTRCEARINGVCMGEAHAPAHKHKRTWYYGKPAELLWDYKQWIACCQSCHQVIEYNLGLTEIIFKRERP